MFAWLIMEYGRKVKVYAAQLGFAEHVKRDK
jgi:hypothetical protein